MESVQTQSSNDQANESMLAYALKYAQNGYAVFPVHTVHINGTTTCSCGNETCGNAGKHPRTKNGLKDATTDLKIITDWWTQWPSANIGLVTGSINGIFVLDVDPKNGGNESLRDLEEQYGALPQTSTVKTGGNGRHFFFKYPEEAQKNSHGFRPGLDIKCDGGYVVATPSLHKSGNRYEWFENLSIFSTTLAECPTWLLALVNEPSEDPKEDPEVTVSGEVTEGKRNETLFKFGCALRRKGCGDEDLYFALVGKNQTHCKPPLEETEVKQITNQCIKTAKKNGTVEMISEYISLFHDSEQKAYATIRLKDHQETYLVHSKQFKNWVSKQYYDLTKNVLKEDNKKDLLSILEAKARYDGTQHEVFVRIGGDDKKIYVDLANEKWEVVEIDETGWKIVKDSPIKFTRGSGMLPLPYPETGGDINALRPFLNILGDEDWILCLGWLVSSFRPKGPYLIKTFIGEQGCAKSTQSKLLRSLIDPYKAPLRVMPTSERDLFITASKSWLQVFDNLSEISNDMADALCRLSTGGGLSTRKLHTDDEEIIFEVMRPAILNGITEVSSRPDLIDRSLLIGLPVIPKNQRRRERELWMDFDREKSKILGALFNAVSCAIKNLGKTELKDLPRMADVVEWVSAAEGALGLKQGDFLNAYNSNRSSAIYDSLEASTVATTVETFMKNNNTWTGTSTVLLHHLGNIIGDDLDKRTWPKNGQVLSSKLRRDAPGLREKGLNLEWAKDGKGRSITITKEKTEVGPK